LIILNSEARAKFENETTTKNKIDRMIMVKEKELAVVKSKFNSAVTDNATEDQKTGFGLAEGFTSVIYRAFCR